ncbi:MAG: hypothetical protein H0U86_03660 [Chloroflexi bacterium]|nr:hypothetical protein [Chloroflexota bacterium]
MVSLPRSPDANHPQSLLGLAHPCTDATFASVAIAIAASADDGPASVGRPGSLSGMTDMLRVILEIGRKRRVVAGAMDWPGLDRWGTSEDDALDKLSSYVPRYAGVAERAGTHLADPVPDPSHGAPCHGSRLGNGGPRPHPCLSGSAPGTSCPE